MRTRPATSSEIVAIMRDRRAELIERVGVVHAKPMMVKFAINDETVTVPVMVQHGYADLSRRLESAIEHTRTLEVLVDQLAQAVKRSLA